MADEHSLKAIAHLNAVRWTRAIELGIDGLDNGVLRTAAELTASEQSR